MARPTPSGITARELRLGALHFVEATPPAVVVTPAADFWRRASHATLYAGRLVGAAAAEGVVGGRPRVPLGGRAGVRADGAVRWRRVALALCVACGEVVASVLEYSMRGATCHHLFCIDSRCRF